MNRALSYQDVYLIPQFSAVHSRSQIDTSVRFRSVQTPEAVYTWPTDTLPTFRYDAKTKTFVVR